MWKFPPMSHSSLVETYISGLNLTSITVVASPDGRCCRIEMGGEIALARCEKIARQFYFRATHAELVLATIDREGATDQAPAAVAAQIERTATALGASHVSPSELRAAAERHVEEIVERIKASGQRGALKHWNARYKQYRLAQVAKGEKAIGYWPFLEQAVMLPTVRDVAATGRMV
jgi:hypothetical protein